MSLTLNNYIVSWGLFWVTYWSLGSLISAYTHFSGVRKIFNLREVVFTVFYNMFWSLLAVICLYIVPIESKFFSELHVIIKMFCIYLCTELWFYHCHIMIHHPQLYIKIHKLHHCKNMNEPYALTALYCSPYETMFLNVVATSIGPILFQPPVILLYMWFVLVAINSLLAHSGLNIPYIFESYHDVHHSDYSKHYGLTTYLDWIYGTL